VGLSSALARLHADYTLEAAIRDVLDLFHRHPRERMSAETVARLTGRPVILVQSILTTLSDGFVLDFDTEPAGYRYVPDTLLEMDIERYLHRVETVNGRLQRDVARFRQRHSWD
jgi:hypothetical protein